MENHFWRPAKSLYVGKYQYFMMTSRKHQYILCFVCDCFTGLQLFFAGYENILVSNQHMLLTSIKQHKAQLLHSSTVLVCAFSPAG